MSEVLAQLEKKGGGGISEGVSLWTNPSPTNNFSEQDVTLSNSIANYRFIKIKFATRKDVTTQDHAVISLIVSSEDLAKCMYNDGAINYITPILALICDTSNKTFYVRPIIYISNTVLHFHNARLYGGSNTVYDVCIPLEIFGVN